MVRFSSFFLRIFFGTFSDKALRGLFELSRIRGCWVIFVFSFASPRRVLGQDFYNDLVAAFPELRLYCAGTLGDLQQRLRAQFLRG